MCLSVVDKVYDPPLKGERWAYKVFDTLCSDIRFPFFPATIKRGVWLKRRARPKTLETTDWCFDAQRYPCGFHVCKTEVDAEQYARRAFDWSYVPSGRFSIERVKVRGILAKGTQCDQEVLVVDELYIPQPKKEKNFA